MTDRRGSVFVDPAPENRAPPVPVPAPVSSSEILGAHWTLGRQDFAGAELQSQIDGYGPIVTELMKRNPSPWYKSDPYTTAARSGMPYNTTRIWQDVARVRQTDPTFMKDIPARNEGEFKAYITKQELERRHAAQDVTQRQQGLAQNTLGFATDVGTGLADPINVGAMVLTGGTAAPVEGAVRSVGGTMARTMLKEAAVNAGTEVVELPIIAGNRQRFGEKMTPGEMVQDVATAGVTGALFPVATHAVGAGAKAVAGAVVDGPIGRATARAVAPLAMGTAPVGRASDAEIARKFAQAVPAEIRTPDEKAALHVIERQADVDATNPFKPTTAGLDAHADRLDGATADILAAGDPNGGAAIRKPVPRRAVAPASIAPEPDARTTFMQYVAHAENATGDPNAKNRLSSATGKYQFTNDTWLRYYKREIGAGGQSDAQILAQRSNSGLQDRLMASLTADNAAHLHSIGAPETAGNLYLEHFAGQGGAERILKADPHTPIESLMSKEAIDANPFLKGKTAGDVIDWAHRKMGGKVHDGPVLARENFDTNEEWAAAQREVDMADAAEQAARAADDRAMAERAANDPGMTPSVPAIKTEVEPSALNLMPPDEPVRAATEVGPATSEAYQAAIPTRNAATLDQSRVHAETFIGQPLQNDATGFDATVSRASLKKMLSQSAVEKSTTAADHALAVANADQLFKSALLDHSHANARDMSKGAGVVAVHRYIAPLVTEDGVRAVKMTVKETAGKRAPNPLYTIETMEVEPGRWAPHSGIEPVPGQGLHTGRPGSNPEVGALLDSVKSEHDMHSAPIEADRSAPTFDKPTDKAPLAQIESIAHDLRMAVESEPDALFRVGDGETERSLSEILADLDAEDAAIAAVKACL